MNYLTDARIFLCLTPTKMSYSFDSLMSQAEDLRPESVVRPFVPLPQS